MTPFNYEEIQKLFTSSSRGTRMGKRVARNIACLRDYLKPPIVCVGCGDGLELECILQALNISIEENAKTKDVVGIEVSRERAEIAQAHSLPVYHCIAENMLKVITDKRNIYAAHCLEHCYDLDKVISNFKTIALNRIAIIVPIELNGKTRNKAHFTPISNLGFIANKFGMDWCSILSYRWNIELEGQILLERDLMNWPEKRARSSELCASIFG